jgi:hypothetical protein
MEALSYKTGHYVDSSTAETVEANPPFVQFYKHSLPVVRKLTKDNSTASQVFLFLVEHMEGDNAIIVSQQAMCEVLGVGRTAIWNAIKYLQDNKYIAVMKSGTSNVYFLNADIVWQQSHDKKRFAKFAARVFLTESEQVEVKKERTVRVQPKRKKAPKTEAA